MREIAFIRNTKTGNYLRRFDKPYAEDVHDYVTTILATNLAIDDNNLGDLHLVTFASKDIAELWLIQAKLTATGDEAEWNRILAPLLEDDSVLDDYDINILRIDSREGCGNNAWSSSTGVEYVDEHEINDIPANLFDDLEVVTITLP